MTLQQIAENFFCAYFFGALSSTEDLPLDFESDDVQVNSQTRMKTVATLPNSNLFLTDCGITGRCQVPPRWIVHTFPGLSDQKADGGEVGRMLQMPFFSRFSYYPPTFFRRTSTSFGYCKPRVVTLSNVVPSADCRCVTRQALSYGLLVCLWLVASSLTKRCAFVCVWSIIVVRGVELLHANFSPCWLFKLNKSGFRNRHLLSQHELLILGCKFRGGLYTSTWHETKLGIVWLISLVVDRSSLKPISMP